MSDQERARGLAKLPFWRRRQIASMGGKAVPAENRIFSRDSGKASEAARKGGKAVAPGKRSFSRDPELAREAGRKGAAERERRRAARKLDVEA